MEYVVWLTETNKYIDFLRIIFIHSLLFKGVPNNGFFETIDQLVVTITAVIYTCSVGHATANFQQYDEYGAPFNYPYLLKGTPPTSKVRFLCKYQKLSKRLRF